jgi:hypothetical protein
MTYYIALVGFGVPDIIDFCGHRIAEDVQAWAESLPSELGGLATLMKTGSFMVTDELARQLKFALRHNRPRDQRVKLVVRDVVKAILTGSPDEEAVLLDDPECPPDWTFPEP